MERINTTHLPEMLEWEPFLSYFCRRGMLRDSEKLVFQFKDLNKNADNDLEASEKYYFMEDDDNDLEAKQERLKKGLKEKLVYKQNMVPKQGKGKYDVTVPVLFEFLKNPNERKSSR